MAAVAKGLKSAWCYVYGVDAVPTKEDANYTHFRNCQKTWTDLQLTKQPVAVGAWLMVFAMEFGFDAAHQLQEAVSDRVEDRYWYLLLTYGGWGGSGAVWALRLTKAFVDLPRVPAAPKE